MTIITHDLLPKQKTRKHNMKVKIELYAYATELWDELEDSGFISRVKEIPQLGVIKVVKKLAKSRYDYIILQLYFHQIIKKNLQSHLRLSYNNYVSGEVFQSSFDGIDDKPSIADILQLLCIIYNIGHFYNTFTASRAVTMLASEDNSFYDKVVNSSENERYKSAAKNILHNKNYHRLHLLNSILILERCNQGKQSVLLALEILYAYINESMLPEESKLKYVFEIFRNVRLVSYMAYDLHIAETPLLIDLCNEKAMILLFRELLSEYNNNQPSYSLVQSATKLLDDTVYNENSDAICYYKISRDMVSQIKKNTNIANISYNDNLFLDKSSILNKNYKHRKDYTYNEILKITFPIEEHDYITGMIAELERINNSRVGYYNRQSGEQTILVSIKKRCSRQIKRYAAFKVMRCVVKYLRKIPSIKSSDVRFILCVKFFLFYLFNENPAIIKPTVDRKKCVICTRGKTSRLKELRNLLHGSGETVDINHEVEFLLCLLERDLKNDTCITIPASIVVYKKDTVGRKLCEFDGMIIHPTRTTNQVIFAEAKNRTEEPIFGKRCLEEKLNKLSIQYNYDDIKIDNYDAYLEYTIGRDLLVDN